MSNYSTNELHDLESGQASPFAIILAALLGIFVLALLCTGAVLFLREGDQAGVSATSTAIAEANATTLAQNARVTQTIAAMETEAARPTNTSTPTTEPTATATTTDTPEPTATEVVAEAEETPTPNLFGTSIFAGEDTPTPISGATTGTGGGTLPDTGINVGTALAIAVGLLFLGLVARRLRTG